MQNASPTAAKGPRGLVLGTQRIYFFPNTFGAARCIRHLNPNAILPHAWHSFQYAGTRQVPFAKGDR